MITYKNDPPPARSRIEQVQHCDAANVCLPATTFSWNSLSTGFSGGNLFIGQNDLTSHAADVDGDGRSDIVWENGAASTLSVCPGGLPTCSTWPLPSS